MGVYIPNMEMPQKGQMLVIFPDGTSYVCFNGMRERLVQTTAVHVPPHGRLIDADAISYHKFMFLDDDYYYGTTKPYIDRMPTIIPADSSKEEK